MTAHTGELMLRQYLETRRSHHLIVLDLNARTINKTILNWRLKPQPHWPFLRCQMGSPNSYAGKTGLKAATSGAALDFLTEVQMQENEQEFSQLVRWVLAHEAQSSVCSLICGPGISMRRLQQICLFPQ